MGKPPHFVRFRRPPGGVAWKLIAAVVLGILLALIIPPWLLLVALALAAVLLLFCVC